jgi:hypothetical protein
LLRIHYTLECTGLFVDLASTGEKGALFFPVSTCIPTLSVPSPSPTPKFLHNNWTWRQRLEYEIREQDEEPKAEDRKRIRTKIRWRLGEEEKKKFPALSDRSRVDRMFVYSVLQISIAFTGKESFDITFGNSC